MPGPIVLLTDFGQEGPFVGMMKGVILSQAPRASVVDLTHSVPPQDLRLAAFQLMISAPYFPDGSIFVCVVDPGVGSDRRVLWARTRGQQFLAPDNGLLSWLERRAPFLELRVVSNPALFPGRVSSTFHGRDVFAPVAAELARGLKPASLGPRTSTLKRLPFPEPARAGSSIRGQVLAVDRFGNAVTSLPEDLPRALRFRFKGRPLGGLQTHYSAVKPGQPLVLAGSSGFLELAVRDGSFAQTFGARAGDAVDGCPAD